MSTLETFPEANTQTDGRQGLCLWHGEPVRQDELQKTHARRALLGSAPLPRS
jgi:hypothetical protein